MKFVLSVLVLAAMSTVCRAQRGTRVARRRMQKATRSGLRGPAWSGRPAGTGQPAADRDACGSCRDGRWGLCDTGWFERLVMVAIPVR